MLNAVWDETVLRAGVLRGRPRSAPDVWLHRAEPLRRSDASRGMAIDCRFACQEKTSEGDRRIDLDGCGALPRLDVKESCGASSAPAIFGMRPCGGNGKRATPSAASRSQTHCRAAFLLGKSQAMGESGAARPGGSQGRDLTHEKNSERSSPRPAPAGIRSRRPNDPLVFVKLDLSSASTTPRSLAEWD